MCHIPLPTILPSSASKGLLESMVEKVIREIDSELSTETFLRESLKEAEYVDTPLLCPLLDCLHTYVGVVMSTVYKDWCVNSAHTHMQSFCTVYSCSRYVRIPHNTYTFMYVHAHMPICMYVQYTFLTTYTRICN